ncbi:DUF3502 domain-containing protein [Cohnella fermenti]|uniref:Extracellular solute-binding protein n=1 Tax=Cohnella fermenti TaxID=2565925 RepID=A0A4S4CF76_9BACL|nr:DUF3502 domain-containing protein [Cohnella fermenti]THF84675.1 extracellular solute-binding protein [Cohnella fermenti]
MKFRNKALAIVALAALSTSLLSACSRNGNENTGEASESKTPATASASPSSTNEASGQPQASSLASADPVTLNFFYHDTKFDITGDSPILKKAAEATNVTLNNVAPAGGETAQAWNLMLASGEIADILAYSTAELNAIASQGALTPLDDLIDQYAPNIKQFLTDHPDIRKSITAADGKIYVIPFVSDGKAQEGWFIRKDWLDKLNLPVPTTVDEYYTTLKAFKEQDPNGNGKADEIPFFARNNVTGPYMLLPLWDAFRGANGVDFRIKDGKVSFGPAEEAYKTAMTAIASWYKEGLIDMEIFTRGNKARDELFANNTGGSLHDWFASTSNFNTTAADWVAGFDLQPIAPPASVSGQAIETTARSPLTTGRGWSISAKTKDPVVAMKYFDYWWTEEGRRLLNFGIEGETYTMVDGKPQFTETVLKEPAVVDYLIAQTGAQIYIGGWQDYAYEQQWTNKIALAGAKLYTDNNYIAADMLLPAISFTAEEENRLKEIKPAIDTYVTETSQKWYMGGADPASGFDAYLAQLKSLGIEEVTAIYQAAYDRYLQL